MAGNNNLDFEFSPGNQGENNEELNGDDFKIDMDEGEEVPKRNDDALWEALISEQEEKPKAGRNARSLVLEEETIEEDKDEPIPLITTMEEHISDSEINNILDSYEQDDTKEEDDDNIFESDKLANMGKLVKGKFKIIGIVVGVLLLLIILSKTYNKIKNKAGSVTMPATPEITSTELPAGLVVADEQTAESANILMDPESLDFSPAIYSTYVICSKEIAIKNNVAIPYFIGTANDGIIIKFPIPLTMYNNVVKGQLYNLYYNKVQINSNVYITNTEVRGIEDGKSEHEETRSTVQPVIN